MAAAVPNPVQPQILWAIPVPPQPFPNRGYYDFYLNLLSDETVARDFLLANNVLPNTKRCPCTLINPQRHMMVLRPCAASVSKDGLIWRSVINCF